MTENKKLLAWVDEAVALCKPANVVWIDGSEAQLAQLRQEGIESGDLEAVESFNAILDKYLK